MAEFWFSSPEAMQATMGSREGQAAAADLPNFATGGVTFLVGEVEEWGMEVWNHFNKEILAFAGIKNEHYGNTNTSRSLQDHADWNGVFRIENVANGQ